ncbi:MAG: hypothetical protein ACOC3Z_02610 [Nanoarchaeota archaeon]
MTILDFIKFKKFNENERVKNLIPYNIIQGIRLNGLSIKKENDIKRNTTYIQSNKIITEGIKDVFEEKGGIIVFSNNVNAFKLSNNKLINFIKNKIESIKNKIFKNKKIDKVINKFDDIYGITIGNFVKGKYKADNGKIFNEYSTSIEIIGISTDILIKVAEEITKEFKQECVLVKDNQNNKIYLVDENENYNLS